MTAGENRLAAIIEACRRQDRASQKELYQLFYSYTLALAMRYLFSPDKKMRPFLGAGFATQPTALSGALVGSIEHAPGYTPMPENASKIPACDVEKIRQWVVLGAKND